MSRFLSLSLSALKPLKTAKRSISHGTWVRNGLMATVILACLGCGWQLRGMGSYQGPRVMELAPEHAYAPLTLAIKENMNRSRIEDRSGASLILYLGKENLQKRVVAVTSIGSPAQYELSLSAEFRYHTRGDTTVVTPQELSVERVFDFDPSSTSAKSEEEDALVEEMRRELAQRILRQARYPSLPANP